MRTNWATKLFGPVEVTKDLKLLLLIGGLYALSVALSNTFVNVFLWKQSGEFIDLALYNLMVVIFQPLSFWAAGMLTKRIDRAHVLRIGVVLMSLFYIAVLLASHHVNDYLLVLGALLGIGVGCYWLAFNVLTFEVTEPATRDFFNGFLGLLTSFAGMTGPLLAGFIITSMSGYSGYFIIFATSLTLFLLAILLTFSLSKRHAHGRFCIKAALMERQDNENWRRILTAHIFEGLREGTFIFVIVVWIYVVAKNELALGMYGLVTSSIQLVCYYVVARFLKPSLRKKSILLGGILLYGAVFLLVVNLSFTKLMTYGIVISIAYPILLIPYVSLTYDVIGTATRASELRVEYIVVREWFINIGRILSIVLFIVAITLFDEVWAIPIVLLIVGSGHLWLYLFVRRIHLPEREPPPETAMRAVNQGDGNGGTV
ncbi:MFS transporter [Bacillus sp. FSL W7-1360]